MIRLEKMGGVHIVTYEGVQYYFDNLMDALNFILALKGGQ